MTMQMKSLQITEEQDEWLDEHDEINFSAFVRNQMDALMAEYDRPDVSADDDDPDSGPTDERVIEGFGDS